MAVFNILTFVILFFAYPVIIIFEFIVSAKYEFKKWYFDLMFCYELIVEFMWEKIINYSVKVLKENDKQTFLS